MTEFLTNYVMFLGGWKLGDLFIRPLILKLFGYREVCKLVLL